VTVTAPRSAVARPILGGSGAPVTAIGWKRFDTVDGTLVPNRFVAVTVQVYVSPFVSPVTRIGLAVALADVDNPLINETHVASNDKMGLPPLLPGVNPTEPAPSPAVATVTNGGCGELGSVAVGTNVGDGPDTTLVPIAFVAVTEHAYVASFVKAVTRIGLVALLAEPDAPPVDDMHDTSKRTTGLPPSAPGVNATDAAALPGVAAPIVGASGTVDADQAADANPATNTPFNTSAHANCVARRHRRPVSRAPARTVIAHPALVRVHPGAPHARSTLSATARSRSRR